MEDNANGSAYFCLVLLAVSHVHGVSLGDDWDQVDAVAQLAHDGDVQVTQATNAHVYGYSGIGSYC
jgi:hypothetical protein